MKRIVNNSAVAINTIQKFVPEWSKPCQSDFERLHSFLIDSRKLLVITGAGISTESGIPDYRSEKVGLYARTNRRPVQHADFIRYASARQRYWARNFVGWPSFSTVSPNRCHEILSEWEDNNKLMWLVTQNVDALHTKAGSKKITELHGCTHWVTCLQCQKKMPRNDLQLILERLNPDFNIHDSEIAPDGDVLLPDEKVKLFKVPSCETCGGLLKPDVVFFGDNVPKPRVDSVFNLVAECDKVFVIGSSLFVYSGYRFIQKAAELQKPVAILNCGPTKADHLIQLKVSAICGDVLPNIKL